MKKKFTVKDLKNIINELPDDMRVVVDGYEMGIDECEDISVKNFFIGGSIGQMCGIHEEAEDYKIADIKEYGDEEDKKKLQTIERCLYLSR